MSRSVYLSACLVFTACGAPESAERAERFVELQHCSALRLQGQLNLVVAEHQADQRRVGVYLRGSAAALAASEVSDAAVLTTISSTQHALEVALSCAALNSLELIGSVSTDLHAAGGMLEDIGVFSESHLQLKGLDAENLTLRVSGGGKVDLSGLLVDEMTILAAGDSRVKLQGEADAARFDVAGSSRVDAADLRVQKVHVQLRGSSRTEVHAGAHLGGKVSESATLKYTGTPDVSVQANRPAALESTANAPAR